MVVTCLRFPVSFFLVLSFWHLLYLEMEVSRREMTKLLIELTRCLENTFAYCASMDLNDSDEGGMAKIYWVGHGTKALKQEKSDPTRAEAVLKTFLRELAIPMLFDHPLCMKPCGYGFFGFNGLNPNNPAAVYAMLFPKMKRSLLKVDESVSRVDRMKILYNIARAMADMHEAEIVHRDLKPANILLDRNNIAFLADFGSSRLLAGQDQTMTFQGTLLYSDPNDVYHVHKSSDVYSFCLIFYVLMFSTVMSGQGELAKVKTSKGCDVKQLVETLKCPQYKIRDFFEKMLHEEREQRLTFRQVVERLKNDEEILLQFAKKFNPWTDDEKKEYKDYIRKKEAELQKRPKMRPNVSHEVVTSTDASSSILDAAKKGDLSAQVNAALLLEAGKGTAQDSATALRYLLSVRQQCPDDPMFRFLDDFMNGTPLQRGLYHEAAADVQGAAGNMQEAVRNMQEAAKCYREGALAGDRKCIDHWAELLKRNGAQKEANQLQQLLRPRKT